MPPAVSIAHSEVSAGECVAVLLAGVYVGAHSLWRVRERLDPYDLQTVMQDARFDLSRFPEERLAKALDDLYQTGTERIMSTIALQTIRAYELDLKFLHFDRKKLNFCGAYEREDPKNANADPPTISDPPPATTPATEPRPAPAGRTQDSRQDLSCLSLGAVPGRAAAGAA